MSIGSVFNIGQSALNAAQACIAVTGNNIANVNTEGYTRQYVRLEDAYALTKRPGEQGQGVDAVEVLRRFDRFLENAYLDKATVTARWDQHTNVMTTVESLFNESNREGVSSGLAAFFESWKKLALRPEDTASRQDLISKADDIALMLRQTAENIQDVQHQMDLEIADDVKRANELIQTIADLNKQITTHTVKNVNNPNSLLDARDKAVRDLSNIIDVKVMDHGMGEFYVFTKSGQALVQNNNTYSLEILGPRSEDNKIPESTYTGSIVFEGRDSHEYTVEMVTGGNVGDTPAPSFRVSLDGGKTWLRDENGQELHYEVTDLDGNGEVDPVEVKDLKISFTELNDFTVGDRFSIVPKDGLYWIEPTKGPQNITPQIFFDGTDNTLRATGGSLAAEFNVRDDNCGRYMDDLNAMAKSLIWEVNRLHSQGAGLTDVTFMQGTTHVLSQTAPLGTAQAGIPAREKLTAGNVQFYLFNSDTGNYLDGGPLDFTGLGTPPSTSANFDPAVHSFDDVVSAINSTYGGQLVATVEDKQIKIEVDHTANPSLHFALGNDTTGLMAALGINSFFQGENAADIAVDKSIRADIERICAGAVNGDNEINPGDNIMANSIGSLINQPVTISTTWKVSNNQSIHEYYSTLVSTVGADMRTSQTNLDYNRALSDDLDAQQAAAAGVNMDEEMANLIKFQHSYTAAAKLITTADQMLQTLLGLKQ